MHFHSSTQLLGARILTALSALVASTLVSAGSYVAEDDCFGGSVPSIPTGLSASTTVTSRLGIYMATAWRQPCQSDTSVSVLLIRFQAVTGSPSVSASDVVIWQGAMGYKPGMLVKNPNASLVIDWGQLGSFSFVNTIVWQSGPRFDVSGRLTIEFTDYVLGRTSMTLSAAPTAPASASVSVHYGNLTDMWWDPTESGTGMSITHHGSNQLFVLWYTYAESGEPLWIVFPGGTWVNPKTFTGSLYKTKGTTYSQPWNQSALQVGSPIGTGTLAFSADDSVTFTFTVNGVSGTRTFTRQRF